MASVFGEVNSAVLHDAAMKRSFQTQIADSRLLQPLSVRDRILSGTYRQMEAGPGLLQPFKGTGKELLELVGGDVHATIERLDYNGAFPYVKIADQLEEGKTFDEVRIDSRNEELGTTCVGGAHAILKTLRRHNVQGMLAVQRKSPAHPLEHGAAIVECSDGFVLLDARSNPKIRIFSVQFGTTQDYPNLGISITASHPGSTTPLTMAYPDERFEYCTNVSNGDDLVMKYFVVHAPFDRGHEFFPIATYNQDGSARKFIGVSFKDSSLFLKDRKAPKGTMAENVPFQWIRENPEAFREKLAAFMEPDESFAGFKIPTDPAFQHLFRIASQETRLQRLFAEAHPKAIV